MIYLSDFIETADQDIYRVGCVHYMPFDEEYGLHKTKEELEANGVFVDELPPEEKKQGMATIVCYDKANNKVVYQYDEIAKSDEQIRNEKLDQILAQQNLLVELQADEIGGTL